MKLYSIIIFYKSCIIKANSKSTKSRLSIKIIVSIRIIKLTISVRKRFRKLKGKENRYKYIVLEKIVRV